MNTALQELAELGTLKYFNEVPENIGYSSSMFMMFGLPPTRLKGNPAFWTKNNGLYEITLARHPDHEIPYGCLARAVQIFIDTEVRTKNTNVIDAGRCYHDFARKLGYKDGKTNKELVKQLLNYVNCTIHLKIVKTTAKNTQLTLDNTLVSEHSDLFFDIPHPNQMTMSSGKIYLSEKYARHLHDHTVPLDMNVVRCFRRNPLALDFYRYMAYRTFDLNKELSFPDHFLFEQLGVGHKHDRLTRQRLNTILRAIKNDWPGLKADFKDGYFVLNPSGLAVPARPASHSRLIITHNTGG
jgi:hypothetical protein